MLLINNKSFELSHAIVGMPQLILLSRVESVLRHHLRAGLNPEYRRLVDI